MDVGQGGLFDPTRDKLLVIANPLYTRFRCSKHKEEVIGRAPGLKNNAMKKWSHVVHVVYYVPNFSRPLESREWRAYGQELQYMFRPRAGGSFVETITILTDTIVEEFRTSLEQGWTEPFGNEKFEKEPREPILNWMDDATTLQQAKQFIDRYGYYF
jgi:hypothetical protein